jgi:hypothetical protein
MLTPQYSPYTEVQYIVQNIQFNAKCAPCEEGCTQARARREKRFTCINHNILTWPIDQLI